MTDEQIKAAEQRGYGRGYNAGRRRAEREAQHTELWNRAFLAALPACISSSDWAIGDKPIRDIPGRTRLAVDFANEAVKHLRR